jgi:beta-phosphoglucomutase-like phosphatase (HAD superfamily)
VAGLTAARSAGMTVLALCHSARPDLLAGADLVRNSIAEIDLDDVLRRLAKLRERI